MGQTAEQAAEHAPAAQYRLWVNDDRTLLVRIWADGTVETARRDTPQHTWGPPVYLREERKYY